MRTSKIAIMVIVVGDTQLKEKSFYYAFKLQFSFFQIVDSLHTVNKQRWAQTVLTIQRLLMTMEKGKDQYRNF